MIWLWIGLEVSRSSWLLYKAKGKNTILTYYSRFCPEIQSIEKPLNYIQLHSNLNKLTGLLTENISIKCHSINVIMSMRFVKIGIRCFGEI